MNATIRHPALGASPTARLTLPVFLALGTGSGVAAGSLAVVLPLYALHLGASPAETGALRAVAGIGALLAVVPAGLATDRFGARWVFFAGSLGAALSLGGCAAAGVPAALGLAMFAEAACRGLQFGALNAAFLQLLPRFGLRRAGWHKGAVSLGLSFFGPVLGGALLGRLPFTAVFAVAAALALAANLLLARMPLPAARAAGSTDTLRARAPAARDATLLLLREPGVRRCLAAEALMTATFVSGQGSALDPQGATRPLGPTHLKTFLGSKGKPMVGSRDEVPGGTGATPWKRCNQHYLRAHGTLPWTRVVRSAPPRDVPKCRRAQRAAAATGHKAP